MPSDIFLFNHQSSKSQICPVYSYIRQGKQQILLQRLRGWKKLMSGIFSEHSDGVIDLVAIQLSYHLSVAAPVMIFYHLFVQLQTVS